MTLWIQPLFGDPFSIPFSPEVHVWKDIYYHLKAVHYPDKRTDQLRLFYKGQWDLSDVKEGDVLQILITEPMAERWISETTKDSSWASHGVRSYHSTFTWLDSRWGDPYHTPAIIYRTSLTLYLSVRETRADPVRETRADPVANPVANPVADPEIVREFMIDPIYLKGVYGNSIESAEVWYPTLREACYAFRTAWNEIQKADAFTEKTAEHIIHLWTVYHGTYQHLMDQGRRYDY